MLINNTWIFKKKLLFINNDFLFNKMKENNIKGFYRCIYQYFLKEKLINIFKCIIIC
jgi:hypothetical protein